MVISTPSSTSTTFIMSILLASSITRLISSTTGVAAFAPSYIARSSSHLHNIFSQSLAATAANGPAFSRRCRQSTRRIPFDSVDRSSNSIWKSKSSLFSTLSTPAEEIDPYSETARNDLAKLIRSLPYQALPLMGYDDVESNTAQSENEKEAYMEEIVTASHKSLLKLTEQVLEWNQRLNLVSRKDCNANVVYHRHVLPSVALLPLILENFSENIDINNNKNNPSMNIADVGTGGGFPGLPLSLLLPKVQFTLIDSVQKKLVAVSEMAAEMEVGNVRVHWGRVEEMDRKKHGGVYDVVVGRSVTALPRYCAWVTSLLKRKTGASGDAADGDEKKEREVEGRLIYIIGGELEEVVESRIMKDMPLDRLLQRAEGTTDKRALVFHASDVREIAEESGELKKVVNAANKAASSSASGKKKSTKSNNNNDQKSVGKKKARGEWSQKRNDIKKDRGYDNFKRYEF